jgi:3-hydroxyacyl-[acyl-carrier-protein] dehydratase
MVTMQYYQHTYDNAEQYLHHRAPYLLVERIVSVEQEEVVTEHTITGDEYFMVGHFPGAPIFPGAMMQEMTTQSAGVLIAANYNPMESFNTEDPFFNEFALGVLVKIKQARYKSFARPGDTLRAKVVLDAHIENVFDFSATITVGESLIMRNKFQLTNIKSSVLQGS